ncbi:MAG: nicotinate phosphoribosyltransferase [Gemmataceae bacterium]|nr:nicotinate phosphoribosyltransferase [Gemmataceae bacterium]
MAQSLFPDERRLGLLTDLYELTMAVGYFAHGLAGQRATFELWMRRVPTCRNYLIAAGLEQAIHYLQRLNFADDQIAYLRGLPAFAHAPPEWFERLRTLRFDGDVWALPEGTVFFAGEPVLRVTAPLMTAQIVETYLIATMTVQTLVASKAARVVTAAQGRPVVDFGSRRAHGPQAGLLAARAACLAGCVGTSNAEAARLLGVAAVGTQAHAWIMAFDDETEAFRRFAQVFPNATLLVDTYDTLHGVRKALACGAPFAGIRLDSGDLLELSRGARAILDQAGRRDVQIVASGDLNEYKIADLLAAGAPIDSFGVGTELVTSRDEPTLSTVYKLVEQETPAGVAGRLKLAAEKKTYPFAKQVFRQTGPDGRFTGDVIGRVTESLPGEPLLVPVMKHGELVRPLDSLEACRERVKQQWQRLPPGLLGLDQVSPYPVAISPLLEEEARRLGKS